MRVAPICGEREQSSAAAAPRGGQTTQGRCDGGRLSPCQRLQLGQSMADGGDCRIGPIIPWYPAPRSHRTPRGTLDRLAGQRAAAIWASCHRPDDTPPVWRSAACRVSGERPDSAAHRPAARLAVEAAEIRLGSPRSAVKKGALIAHIAATLAAGGTAWCGHERAARDAAAGGVRIGWLPFRSPDLNPCEDVWRELKRVVAANRAYTDVNEQVQRGVERLDDRSSDEVLCIAGLQSSKFDWLPT